MAKLLDVLDVAARHRWEVAHRLAVVAAADPANPVDILANKLAVPLQALADIPAQLETPDRLEGHRSVADLVVVAPMNRPTVPAVRPTLSVVAAPVAVVAAQAILAGSRANISVVPLQPIPADKPAARSETPDSPVVRRSVAE